MPNRLADASSLYLNQHADNPVDWWPWCDEALELARRQDRPIFLSIGYSSCHWCHVMAHECFEDEEVAQALSQYFVAIKLDREERPDIDEVYMAATQMANGHGGWPMSVFLTPGLEPFYTSTYIPREALLQTVVQLGEAWRRQRNEVLEAASQYGEAVKSAVSMAAGPIPAIPVEDILENALSAMEGALDPIHGGFGDRPKFPPYCDLLFLQELGGERADRMVKLTLDHMVNGGLFDHVGGGFHRYSTDERWHLPHFEKMLSDNALALTVLKRARFDAAAERIMGWLEREMKLPLGGYGSALDAGADGVEGRPYVWSWDELKSVLGERLATFAPTYQVEEGGNYDEEATRKPSGLNVLNHRVGSVDHGECLDLLLNARLKLPQPARDDKALVSANALASIASGDDRFVNEVIKSFPDLPHHLVDGQPQGMGFLDDYVFCGLALLEAGDTTGAGRVMDEVLTRFAAPVGLAHSSAAHQTPLARQVGVFDSATPNAFSTAILVLARLGRHETAWNLVGPFLHWAVRAPMGCATLLRALLVLEGSAQTAPQEGKVNAVLSPRQMIKQPDGYFHGVVKLAIPPGYHINSYDPDQDWLVPTTIRIDGAFGEAGFPQGHQPYSDDLEIPIRVMPKGASRSFEVRVTYQLCSDHACFEPQTVTLQGLLEPG
jgi:uncharacterized protein YyaL (SSP411 family)